MVQGKKKQGSTAVGPPPKPSRIARTRGVRTNREDSGKQARGRIARVLQQEKNNKATSYPGKDEPLSQEDVATRYDRALRLVEDAESVLDQDSLPQASTQAKKILKESLGVLETTEACDALGDVYLSEGRENNAVLCFNRAVELNGKDHLAHARLSEILMARGARDEAIQYLREAVSLLRTEVEEGKAETKGQEDPSPPARTTAEDVLAVYYTTLGDLYREAEQRDDWFKTMQEGVEVLPHQGFVWLGLAKAALGPSEQGGMTLEAIEAALQKGLSLCRDADESVPLDALLDLSQVILAQGRENEAEEILKELAEGDDGGGHASDEEEDEEEQAENRSGHDHVDRARTVAQQALFQLGKLHFQRKDLRHAEALWQKYLNRDREADRSEDAEVLGVLSLLCAQEDRWAEAEDFAKRAIKRENNVPEHHLTLGDIYVEQGLYSQALPCFERAARLDPEDVEAQSRIVEARKYVSESVPREGDRKRLHMETPSKKEKKKKKKGRRKT